jgi:hypothetical protein
MRFSPQVAAIEQTFSLSAEPNQLALAESTELVVSLRETTAQTPL